MATLLHTLNKHLKDINCCSFSANSKCLVSVSSDKTIRYWNVKDGSELLFSPVKGHSYSITACSFSPLGTILATGSQDCSVIIWDAENGEEIKVLLGHKGMIRCCTFSHNSNFLATASSDETIGIWSVKTFLLVRILKGPESPLMTCHFTPDDLYIVSGSGYGDARIWDISTGKCEAMVEGHDSGSSGCGITGCDFSPVFGAANTNYKTGSGESPCFLLATCGGDNLVKLWYVYTASAHSMKCNFEFRCNLVGHSGHVYDCKFSTDGKLLVSCSSDRTVILWDPLNQTLLKKLSGHSRYINTVCLSPDGTYLATGSNDKTIQVWQLDDFINLSSPPYNPETTTTSQGQDIGQPKRKLLRTWSIDDVCAWLHELSLDQYCEVFRNNAIDGIELVQINEEMLLSVSLGIGPLGHRNKIMRELKELKRIEMEGNVPDEFLCPITRELMSDPVLVADGFTYERSSITSWIQSGKISSPMTNTPLPHTNLIPNRSLKSAIMRYFGPAPMNFLL